jgi:hypothetical protein
MNHISNEEFVTAWQKAEKRSDIKLEGMSYQSITQRASWLRKNGVNLKKFRLCLSTDVPALNKLIAKL